MTTPGSPRVFYRFRKIHATIVVKTHMVFVLDDAKLQRFDELFIRPEWLQPPHPVGYDPKLSANPFVAFEQIPPRSRYQFLLDNANYVMKTFIHGPVCKGQIALNVLDDHFWVMFMDPDHDDERRLSGFSEAARRQAAPAHREGQRLRHLRRADRRVPQSRGGVLQGSAGLLHVAQLRRPRL